MNNFSRLTIYAIKQAFADYVSGKSIDTNILNNAHQQLNFELDRLVVAKEPTEEIEPLLRIFCG